MILHSNYLLFQLSDIEEKIKFIEKIMDEYKVDFDRQEFLINLVMETLKRK